MRAESSSERQTLLDLLHTSTRLAKFNPKFTGRGVSGQNASWVIKRRKLLVLDTSKRIRRETPDVCSLSIDIAGSDEGYDGTFPVYIPPGKIVTIHLVYNTFGTASQIIISVGGSTTYDSGCVATGGPVTADFDLPGGAADIRVIVFANCLGGSGAAWEVQIHCDYTNEP